MGATTIGDKNQIKVTSLSEGKGILTDITAVLEQTQLAIKEALQCNEKRELKKLPSKISLTLKAIQRIDEIFDTVLKCDGNHFLATRLLSAATAKQNMEEKLVNRVSTSTAARRSNKKSRNISNLERATTTPSSSTKPLVTPNKSRINPKRHKTEPDIISRLLNYQQPEVKDKRYSILQLIHLFKTDSQSPIFELPIKPTLQELRERGLCIIAYSTFMRHWDDYNTKGIIPGQLEGLKVGRPVRVNDAQIESLKKKVVENCGVVQHPIKNVTEDILTMDRKKGFITKVAPCRATLKHCMHRVGGEEGVSVVPEKSARPQGARRQMAGLSSRNCMSQLATLILSNFTPGKYEIPKELPEGCRLAHKIAENIAGCQMKPIQPFQLINHDMTSTYVHDGVHQGDSKHDKWCLVSTTSQETGTRKRKSIIIDREEVKCNGLTVKWDAGASASGHVFPMVGIFSGLSSTEMPTESFLVIEVKGMCVNSHLDVRSKENGYIVFLRSNEKMDQYFEWYDTNILYPYYRQLLEQYLGIPADQPTEFDEQFHARVYVDSDMQQISQLMQVAIMRRNYVLGMAYSKIGAKTTMNYQPMDLGKFFKCIKSKTRTTTTQGTDCPLRKVMIAGLADLQHQGLLILPKMKRLAITDCVASAPKIHGESYSPDSIKAAFVHCGFRNEIDACPDIHAVMQASNVPFSQNPNLKSLFLKHILDCTLQMSTSTIGIPESYFDELEFPVDQDLSGNVWPLTDDKAIVFRRAQPLTSRISMQQKQALLVKNLEDRRQNRSQSFQQAREILLMNSQCVEALLKVGNKEASSDPSVIKDLDLHTISKIKSKLLECFVRVRVQPADLTEKWKAPAKGNEKKIGEGKNCMQTGQQFLIQQVKNLASSPVIGRIPTDLPPIEIPILSTAKPVTISFGELMQLQPFKSTEKWCQDAAAAVESIKVQGAHTAVMLDMDDLNSTTRMFGQKLLARLPSFLSTRLPSNRPDLAPGIHWHWKSFSSKLPRLATLVGLSGHICRGLECRRAHENLLEHKEDAFLVVTTERDHWDGAYGGRDETRGETNRIGASHAGLGVRWKEGHAKYAAKKVATSKLRRQAREYPMQNIAGDAAGRRGTFEDLTQICCLGMERSKIDSIINLFEWTDEENNHLQQLPWKGSSIEGSLKNRQYRHLTYLFELTYTLAIVPGQNHTDNPTSEWELNYFGE